VSAQPPQNPTTEGNKGASDTGGNKDKSDGSNQQSGNTSQTTYSPNDTIAQKVDGELLWESSNAADLTAFNTFIGDQSNGEEFINLLQTRSPKQLPADAKRPRNVLIVHAVVWNEGSDDSYQPQKGAWAFYRVGKGEKFHQDFDVTHTPYLYNAPAIYLIDVNYFDKDFNGNNATLNYKITTTARQRQNATDVATLANTLLKLKAASKAQPQVWGAVTRVTASTPVPFDLAITASVKGKKGHDDYISCDPSPCSFSKTVTAYDPEYWDISLGTALPGVLEDVYPKNATAQSKPSPTRHTDAYAFVDVYPFQHFANAPATLTYIPHFNFGIPITGQSLHRPYAGMAENLSFLTRWTRLNIPLAAYAGPVFMKQQVFDAKTSTLKWDHAIKGLYGLELPMSAITNYLKSASKGSK